jgi:hypothetical protein
LTQQYIYDIYTSRDRDGKMDERHIKPQEDNDPNKDQLVCIDRCFSHPSIVNIESLEVPTGHSVTSKSIGKWPAFYIFVFPAGIFHQVDNLNVDLLYKSLRGHSTLCLNLY